jgi:hypothetical protein
MIAAPKSSLVRRGTAASMILLVVFLAAWQWGPGSLGIPTFIIPPLSMVWDEALRMWQVNHLLLHTAVTAAEVLAGFVLGSILGAVFGYLLGMSPTAEFALSPYILALQIAPKVAFAPLFILWMGFTAGRRRLDRLRTWRRRRSRMKSRRRRKASRLLSLGWLTGRATGSIPIDRAAQNQVCYTAAHSLACLYARVAPGRRKRRGRHRHGAGAAGDRSQERTAAGAAGTGPGRRRTGPPPPPAGLRGQSRSPTPSSKKVVDHRRTLSLRPPSPKSSDPSDPAAKQTGALLGRTRSLAPSRARSTREPQSHHQRYAPSAPRTRSGASRRKVSHARSVGDFADAACVLSKGQLELSSRQVSELVTLAQKTTIIALDAGSAAPTPPRPIPERPNEAPLPGPGGPRTPYPVNDPGIADPGKPGSEPDYMPSPLPGVDPPAI